jgi:diguanylate cyclase (GGDEF)-like protein
MNISARRSIVVTLVFAAYVLAGKVALRVAFAYPGVSPIWLPAGVALAAFLLAGYRVWPAVLLGTVFVSLTTKGSLAASIAIGVGTTLDGLLGAYLVQKFTGGSDVFNTAHRIFRFTALMAVASTPIGATVGATTLWFAGLENGAAYRTVWTALWLADLTGVLLVTPLVILWATAPRLRWRPAESLEAVLLFALLITITLLVFAGVSFPGLEHYPLEFLCVPFLLWAAFRFGRREVALVMALIAAIAAWGTYLGDGPFVRQTAHESLFLLQAYLGVTAVMSLALAAVVAESKQGQEQLRELSMTDALTELGNYRHLIEVLRAEIGRSGRTKRTFAVLFIDMDGLKQINDRYGHLAGSRALCRVADALRRCCRSTDMPARFGGDEFAVVLPETGEIGGYQLATRISQRLLLDDLTPAISVSVGVAEFPRDGATPSALLGAADGDLYKRRHPNAITS